MKKTEYVSFSDQELIKLLQDVGSDYSALELIDENNNVDASWSLRLILIISSASWMMTNESNIWPMTVMLIGSKKNRK